MAHGNSTENNQTPIINHQIITNIQLIKQKLSCAFLFGYSVIGYWVLIGY